MDSVGPLALRLPLDSLIKRCPKAVRGVHNSFESVHPAIIFTIGSLTVTGFQPDSDSLDTRRRAPAWEVKGCGGTLPKEISTCATWSAIVAAYGSTGEGSTEFGPASVRLDSMPDFEFELDVTRDVVGSLEVQPNLARVPGTARLMTIVFHARLRR